MTKTYRLTAARLKSLQPCDLDVRLEKFGARKSLTPRQAAEAGFKLHEIVWVAAQLGLWRELLAMGDAAWRRATVETRKEWQRNWYSCYRDALNDTRNDSSRAYCAKEYVGDVISYMPADEREVYRSTKWIELWEEGIATLNTPWRTLHAAADVISRRFNDGKGRATTLRGNCTYLGAGGNKCAVGALFPDTASPGLTGFAGSVNKLTSDMIYDGGIQPVPNKVKPEFLALFAGDFDALWDSFLNRAQCLHDYHYNWDDDGVLKGHAWSEWVTLCEAHGVVLNGRQYYQPNNQG